MTVARPPNLFRNPILNITYLIIIKIGFMILKEINPFTNNSNVMSKSESDEQLFEFYKRMTCLEEKISQFAVEIISKYPNLTYKDAISLTEDQKIPLFVYGSLMDKSSSNREGIPTIKTESLNTHRPAIAFGTRRLYNYEYKKDLSNLTKDPKEKACLNLVPCSKKGAFVNGSLINIDLEDMSKLIDRETGYSIAKITVVDWKEARTNTNPAITHAYTFIALDEPHNGVVYTDSSIKPICKYVEMVEKAVRSQKDELFYKIYNATTYFADGKTLCGIQDLQ